MLTDSSFFCVKYSICHEDSRTYSIEGDYATKCSFWSEVLLQMFKLICTALFLFPSLHNPCAHDCLYKLLGKKFTRHISDYLVTIDYWVLQMSPAERVAHGVNYV